MPKLKYFKEALSKVSQGILITDHDQCVVFTNSPLREMMDVPDALVAEGRDIADFLHFLALRGDFGQGDPDAHVRSRLASILPKSPYRSERQCPDGRFIFVAGNPLDDGGYVFTYTDVTERQRERERLAAEVEEKTRALRTVNRELGRLALLDPLLGIPNRRRFTAIANRVRKQMTERRTASIVMMLDIDHFKAINDQHGHATGDAVLLEVVARIRHLLGPNDHLARYGGEEFVILLPTSSSTDGWQFAESVRLAIVTSPIFASDTEVVASVSVGLSEWRPNEPSIDVVLTRADAALYEAKRDGRNRCHFAP